MLPNKLSKEEKKALLLKKYAKRDTIDVDDCKKYAVFWQPLSERTDAQKWIIIAVCDTLPEAKEEIKWRYQYHKTSDRNLVLDNDKRFETFRDETLHKDEQGNTIEPENIKVSKDGNVKSFGDMVDREQMGKTFFESLPQKKDGSKFRTMGYYAGIELEYRGYYKIEEIYDVEN